MIGRSRGGLTGKIHLVSDGKGRPLGLVLTGGNAADTTFFQNALQTIDVRGGGPGRPPTMPDRCSPIRHTRPGPTVTT